MMMRLLQVLTLFLTASPAVSAKSVKSSKLNIHIPQNLFRSEGYDHRESLFGSPPFGSSIVQNIYYADSDLCDPNVDTRIGFPERPRDDNGVMQSWPSPYILMVDRGDCTFVKKVRNAQRAGAAAVIIADTSCLCSDQDCLATSDGSECESAEPILADDGSGADISIPSFLMFKVDADAIKAVLKQNQPIQMEMSWALPAPDDRVEYDLWTTPADEVSKYFLSNFKDAALAFGHSAYFTPHMYIYDGVKSGCQADESVCENLCTNHGRYCATDPDNDLKQGISGADVVKESLRRICIWRKYGEANGVGLQWWNYVAQFYSRCEKSPRFQDENCVRDVYRAAHIDGDAIEKCMQDSGGTEADGLNVILESALEDVQKRGVVVMPSAYVNTAVIRGALTFTNVFDAICAGFAAGTAPDVCTRCVSNPDTQSCVNASTGDNRGATMAGKNKKKKKDKGAKGAGQGNKKNKKTKGKNKRKKKVFQGPDAANEGGH